MNTHGHHGIADDAGLKLLEEAFRELAPGARLGAFYMGNWLTDLSQVVDPVAAVGGRDKIDGFIHDAVDTLLSHVYFLKGKESPLLSFYELVSGESADGQLRRARTRLQKQVHALFEALLEPDENGRTLYYNAAHAGTMVMGYFKFVHPEKPDARPRMDMSVYLTLFNEFFTQYWPYEHLDRPAPKDPVSHTPGSDLDPYDTRQGTLPTSRPGIYDYLQEHIELIGAELTELDLTWAPRFLSREHTDPHLDEDLDWNRGLARLGHAVHGVEDFFAHSNFIEHAARGLEGKFLPRAGEMGRDRFLKRLKRYDHDGMPALWTECDPEGSVVTGYFDFLDTLVSLGHVGEHLLLGKLEIEARDPTRVPRYVLDGALDVHGTDRKLMEAADQAMGDFMELLTNPARAAAPGSKNSVLEPVRWFVTSFSPFKEVADFTGQVNKLAEEIQKPAPDVRALQPLLRAMPLFQEVEALGPGYITPQNLEVLYRAVLTYLRYMTIRKTFGEGATAFTTSLYEVLKAVVLFRLNPVRWLGKEILLPLVGKQLAGYATYLAKEMLYDAIAADRIGSHSLLGKDHEDESELYKASRDCATAAHYYVVHTMLRWGRDEYRSASVPESRKWVDWQELLEHFLCHPTLDLVCTQSREVPVRIIHPLEPADRDSSLQEVMERLADRYLPLSLKPTGLPFSDKSILHANASTVLKRVNPVQVAETALVGALAPPLLPVLQVRRLLVPYIRYNVELCDPATTPQRWFMPVMRGGWKVVEGNPRALMHVLRFHPGRPAAEAVVARGELLRQELQERYQP